MRRGGRQGGKGPFRGGRRSNEPTSHGVVPTRALSRVSSFFSAAAYQVSSGFSLFLLPRRPAHSSRLSFSRAYIIHISTLMFFDYVVRRSTFPPIFQRLLPYGRARSPPQQYLAKLFDGKLHRRSRPTGLLFRNKL